MKKTTTRVTIAVTVVGLGLLWSFRASSTEQNEAEHVAARDAFQRLKQLDEHGAPPPAGAWDQAYEQKAAMPILRESWLEFWRDPLPSEIPAPPPLPWVSIGPDNISGRIRSFVIHPTQTNTIWAGAISGGIWKTVNGGGSWSCNTDFLTNVNVSCMAIDPFDPAVLYAGTGGQTFTGNGIYKTTDSGESWWPLSSTYRRPEFTHVNRIAINRNGLLLAATSSGMYQSGDKGESWGRSVGMNGEAFDVRFHPTSLNQCIASGLSGDVYTSSDSGSNWERAYWPVDPIGGVTLAYAESEPSIVYAQGENKSGRLFRSTDGGHTYATRGPCCSTAMFYTNSLWVSPTDANIVVYGGMSLFRSTDGGLTVSAPYINTPHQDHQLIVSGIGYNGTSNKSVYCATDGGIFRTKDILRNPVPPPPFGESAVEWEGLNNGLATTQFYGVTANSRSGVIIGGTQDNGTLRFRASDGPMKWRWILGGDGGIAATDQTDPNYFYLTSQSLAISRTTDGGNTTQFISANLPHACNGFPCANFIAPIALDPNNPNCLFAGGDKLWKTPNAKAVKPANIIWVEVKPATSPIPSNINVIAIAEGNSNILWTGHNDGSVFYTQNGGGIWTQVTGLPARFCTDIAIGREPAAQKTIYVTFGGFSSGNIWKSANGVWTDVSVGLPRSPIHTVSISPFNPQTIYIGTEIGIFASNNSGATWSPANGGPANVYVSDLAWMDHTLIAATFGRGIFTLSPTSH